MLASFEAIDALLQPITLITNSYPIATEESPFNSKLQPTAESSP
jgi:hypothetical protein